MTIEEKIKELAGGDFLCKCPCCEVEGQEFDRPITLADVLRAIEKIQGTDTYFIAMDGTFCVKNSVFHSLSGVILSGNTFRIDLTTDYDNQTQEVKAFIGKLLNL